MRDFLAVLVIALSLVALFVYLGSGACMLFGYKRWCFTCHRDWRMEQKKVKSMWP